MPEADRKHPFLNSCKWRRVRPRLIERALAEKDDPIFALEVWVGIQVLSVEETEEYLSVPWIFSDHRFSLASRKLEPVTTKVVPFEAHSRVRAELCWHPASATAPLQRGGDLINCLAIEYGRDR